MESYRRPPHRGFPRSAALLHRPSGDESQSAENERTEAGAQRSVDPFEAASCPPKELVPVLKAFGTPPIRTHATMSAPAPAAEPEPEFGDADGEKPKEKKKLARSGVRAFACPSVG